MSTANKLTYLNDTKQLLKQKINNLGGDITDNTTFRQYADELQNVYDIFPKTSYSEGSNITLSNTLKGKLDFEDGIVGIGDTSQYTTTGKQLIPLNEADFTTTYYGQNVEIKNQTIKINGSASDIYSISVGKNGLVAPTSTDKITFEVNSGTYKYTQFATGTAYSGIKVRLKDENTGTMYVSESTITLTETHTFSVNIFIEDTNNKNAEIKIQLESGTTAHNWEPYTNGASPSPSYPQDIEVVRGTQTVYIKDENNNIIDTKTINLGEYEFAKIGNYVDTIEYDVENDKVYKNEKIGKYTMSENDTISINTTLDTTTRVAMYSALSDKPSVDVSVKLPMSNYFIGVQNWSADVVGIYTNSSSIVCRVPKTIGTTDTQIKTWLATNKPLVYYVLATPTKTEITDATLKDQIKALYYSHSFTGTTIIEIDGQLPLIIKVRALKGE